MRDFFGVVFKLKSVPRTEELGLDPGFEEYVMSCVGIGYLNVAAKVG